MIPHATELTILAVIILVFCCLCIAAIDWIMKGYQYDKDE